jgi:hypothetical protein
MAHIRDSDSFVIAERGRFPLGYAVVPRRKPTPPKTVPHSESVERAITFIRDALDSGAISQRALAEEMQCSQGRVGKILTMRTKLRLEDLEAMARVAKVTLVELVRERGREFVADLTPTELAWLHTIRQLTTVIQAHLFALSKELAHTKSSGKIPKRASGNALHGATSSVRVTPFPTEAVSHGGDRSISDSELRAELTRLHEENQHLIALVKAFIKTNTPSVETAEDHRSAASTGTHETRNGGMGD